MLICLAFIKENFPWPLPFISHCITFRNVCSTYWVLNLQDFASLRLTIKKPHLLLKILKIHGLVSNHPKPIVLFQTTQNPSSCFKPPRSYGSLIYHQRSHDITLSSVVSLTRYFQFNIPFLSVQHHVPSPFSL